jgi:transcription initiation factor TFIIE subunit alpha
MLCDPIVNELLMDITNDEKTSVSIIECILTGVTSDLEIAEKTEIHLNTVRKVLYKLYDVGIATYKRTKDSKNNWESYNWKFEQNRVFDLITKKYEKLSKENEKSIEYEEENMFFICKANGHRYEFEKASEINFKCAKCGESLEYQDNSTIIADLLKEKAIYISMGKLKEK